MSLSGVMSIRVQLQLLFFLSSLFFLISQRGFVASVQSSDYIYRRHLALFCDPERVAERLASGSLGADGCDSDESVGDRREIELL